MPIHRKILKLIPGGGVVDTALDIIGGLAGGGGGNGGTGCGPGRVRSISGGCVVPLAGASECVPPRFLNPVTGGCSLGLAAVNGTDITRSGPCDDPSLVRDADGVCRFPGSPSGVPGEARKGRFGAGVEPMFVGTTVRRCPAGMVLGKGDDFSAPLCYEKGAISNKERLWPVGTRPLLTGGEMAAIRKATSAKNRVARAAKRLGVMKPATRRSLPRHAHARPAQPVLSLPV